MSRYNDYDEYPRYIPVAERQATAAKKVKNLCKQGYEIQPIESFRSRKIAQSFWGHAWCRHLESYSDYENRLPRGRSYVRNGSVCHLEIKFGQIEAFVSGSELYKIKIKIDKLPAAKWTALKKSCTGKIGSLLELLQGKLSDEVMTFVTNPREGLFPDPQEIHLDCNCPDYADLCKHLASVLYGVGVRLDDQPELLFLLRGVDQNELIETSLSGTFDASKPSKRRRIATTDLSNIFGVDVSSEAPLETKTPDSPAPLKRPIPKTPAKKAAKKVARKKKLAPKKTTPPPSPKTGNDIRKIRRKFGMSEYEFGFIIDVSAQTIGNWESKGKSPHNARKKNQQKLDTIASLTKPAAWDRLNEYL